MTGPPDAPVIELSRVSKDYHGLRPLRIEQLTLRAGEQIALLGFDGPMAETFVNLVTGAMLPDSGVVTVFGQPTSGITDSADWLATVDRFGIVSERAVLLDAMTVIQNLALPFTVSIDPPAEEFRARAALLAAEAGIADSDWSRPVGDLDPAGRFRIRLARALALDPRVLLLEHASAALPRSAVTAVASDIRAAADRRGCALLAAGADAEFAEVIARRVLVLDPATGRLSEKGGRWSFFRRG